jgi:hypothetical protein
MFTWICPKCGGEVLPAYSECPRCAEAQGRVAQPAQPAAPPPPPAPVQQPAPPPVQQPAPPPVQAPVYQAPAPAPPAQYAPPPAPPPVYEQPAPPPQAAYPPAYEQQAAYPPAYEQTSAYPPQAYILPEPKKRMPAWLVVLLVFGVLGGGLYGLYQFFGSGTGTSGDPAAPALSSITEEGDAHPFRRHLEITGLRLFEDNRKNVVLRYTVVNHSPAELPGVELRVLLTTKKAAEKDPAIAEITAKVGDIPAQGAKEMEAPIKTSLRAYELPDWQFLDIRFSVTAPAR